ncbi:hypothetical protein ACFL6U_17535 [Planctomycetota bacterium]
MMKRTVVTLLVLLTMFGTVCVSTQAADDEIQLPPQDSAEYWVVRSRSVSELITFLTKKRTELTADLNHFTSFLEKVGKADDFAGSNIEVPDGPEYRAAVLGIIDSFEDTGIEMPKKSLSWEQMVELAMKFTVVEGYLPVDFKDGEELARYKRVLKNRESFSRDVRKDVSALVEGCLKAWFYLGSINQQDAFKLFVFQEEQMARQAAAEKQAEARAQRADKAKDLLEKSKEEELRRRQDRLNRSYGYGYW